LTIFMDSLSATLPKTTWRPSSQEVTTVVMKNWEPLLQETKVSARLVQGANGGNGRGLRVGTGVGHRKKAGLVVLQLEVLIGELLAVDGLAARAL
jgi:hypothetical protein